ncbi:MAG TPA: hypothetical protein VD902_12795 [Symbiobacteriaceae bacterium]|nr:hypothetical protein [Symbiobacteriaceae bacterium]
MFTSVFLGWLGRRIPEVGGIAIGGLFALIQFYNAMPPAVQEIVQRAATGHWHEITLGSLPGLAIWAWGQWKSYKATVTPQVVTQAGEKIELNKLPPGTQATVTATVEAAPRSRTILEALSDKLNRSWSRK